MNDIPDLAAQWGVAADYFDAFGNRRAVGQETLARIVGAISGGRPPPHRRLPATIVVRAPRTFHVEIPGQAAADRVDWEIVSGERVIARGWGEGRVIVFPDLPIGSYELRIAATRPEGALREAATLLIAPQT